jgi:hypothetical protein
MNAVHLVKQKCFHSSLTILVIARWFSYRDNLCILDRRPPRLLGVPMTISCHCEVWRQPPWQSIFLDRHGVATDDYSRALFASAPTISISTLLF